MSKFLIMLCIILSVAVKSEAVKPVERAGITKDGEIVALRGEGRIMFVNDRDWLPAVVSQTITSGDTLKTGSTGKLAINPNSSEAYALLGRYHYLSGRGKESEKSFKKAVELDPKNSRAFSEYGRLLMDKGEFEESLNSSSFLKNRITPCHITK